jgi:outer membrane receptor protein involved in Fe transport
LRRLGAVRARRDGAVRTGVRVQGRLSVLLATACVACASQANAQASSDKPTPAKPAPSRPATGKTVEGLTVTGQSANGFRSSIDRRSYGVANDLAATTGSISDALKNIPSVEVDISGNVSLRGDPNVTIMIDGKPSTLFKGPGAAQALQALPADQIERVEVITNPSAQFSPEGSAGIINLITKQSRRAGKSGSVRANLGTAGRRNFGAGVAYNAEKLTLSADAAWRHDPQRSTDDDVRITTDPVSARRTTFTNFASNIGPLEITTLRLGVDDDLDKATRLSGEARYNNFAFHPADPQHIRAVDDSGAVVESLEHISRYRQDRANTSGGANYRHTFAGDDHVLTANLNLEHTAEAYDQSYRDATLAPVVQDVFGSRRRRNSLDQTEVKADYNRPMPTAGRLKVGYDYRLEDNDYATSGLRGPTAASVGPDLTQTNHYHYRLSLNAAYATYEQPFGDWTVLGGLRLEDARLDLDQLDTRQFNRQAYTRVYPSLHLADKLSDSQQLILSYSERILRPNPLDLNAFRFVATTTAREGNPDLKPQITHSFEAGWQLKDAGTFYLATLYYRQNSRGVTEVVSELPGDILLTSKANLSQSRNAGVELVANGKLTRTLSYNASTNVYWNEIDATHVPLGPGLGFGGRRSALTVGGRASLNWQATGSDLFQVNVQETAKRLLPQGFIEPMTLVFLGYRHKFSNALSAVVTVQDPTNIYRQRTRIESPGLTERTVDRGRIQAAFVGLTWSFGAAQKRPQTFDFGGGPGD